MPARLEGDFRGAIRLASLDDILAPMNQASFKALSKGHPLSHPHSIILSLEEVMQDQNFTITVTEEQIIQAICSFLRFCRWPRWPQPQHLDDTVLGDGSPHVLVSALAAFLRLVLEGRTPTSIHPFFCGTNIMVLHKKQEELDPLQWVAPFGKLLLRYM